jgi:hypothetical protein
MFDIINQQADLVRRLRCLARQGFHLRYHDREPLTGFAGPGRLNRRIQRQKIGLLGDVRYQIDESTDRLRGGHQSGDRLLLGA